MSRLTWLMLFCFYCSLLFGSHGATDNRKVYIVYMGDVLKGELSAPTLHANMLKDVVNSASVASDILLYSYKRSFNGFAAKLSKYEAEKLRGKEGVVSVFPSEKMKLHTTRSWDFTGFPVEVNRAVGESDIIVGLIDTGAWPESESFNDKGFGPHPKKWKGTCKTSNFTCNKKLIGAKFYHVNTQSSEQNKYRSPRDTLGHGTHTASTAAGNIVSKASLYGLAQGTARGAVPSARIAIYKACWDDGCDNVDILAAFDDAIADGVDIISVSLGSTDPRDYFQDSIAIGAFHAMKNGVLVSTSAGNEGPRPSSVTSVSPWTLSVAASTIDRKFVTNLKLGDGQIFQGNAIDIFDLNGKMYPLIYSGDALNTSSQYDSTDASMCLPESLNKTMVKGKILFCDEIQNVNKAGARAVGAITSNGYSTDPTFSSPLPSTTLNLEDGRIVLNYIKTAKNPTATIYKTTQENMFAPIVAAFSSRGPNYATPDILKPDLTAPGVNILAAWSPDSSMTGLVDNISVKYNIISGTSMACPHASGLAAYIKSFHPTWSPAAIRSALMTTATPMNAKNSMDGEFAYGAGHINPVAAIQPGLVYDAGEIDYIKFLCGQGYNPDNLYMITGNNISCSDQINVWDLNYPSFVLSTSPGTSITRVFHRTVTNVGPAVSTYKANVKAGKGLEIKVEPCELEFNSVGQTQSFIVTATAELGANRISGSLVWDNGVQKVRSPIVAYGYA